MEYGTLYLHLLGHDEVEFSLWLHSLIDTKCMNENNGQGMVIF